MWGGRRGKRSERRSVKDRKERYESSSERYDQGKSVQKLKGRVGRIAKDGLHYMVQVK